MRQRKKKGEGMNGEGYQDPTAEKAMARSKHLPSHIWNPIRLIRQMLQFLDLDLIEIVVEDRRTKRRYRHVK